MNHSNFEITTGSGGIDTTRCGFMYGQIGVSMNYCDRDKGHAEPHRDSRTGISCLGTFVARLDTTSSAT